MLNPEGITSNHLHSPVDHQAKQQWVKGKNNRWRGLWLKSHLLSSIMLISIPLSALLFTSSNYESRDCKITASLIAYSLAFDRISILLLGRHYQTTARKMHWKYPKSILPLKVVCVWGSYFGHQQRPLSNNDWEAVAVTLKRDNPGKWIASSKSMFKPALGVEN